MINFFSPTNVRGLPPEEYNRLLSLTSTFEMHQVKNAKKDKYYEGAIRLADVNLGIALPDGLARLEIGCSWGAKAVDVLAARSMFDGFVGESGEDVTRLDSIVQGNGLIAEYAKACRDELKYGCTFATLSKDSRVGCKIRFHSPQTAAAIWDGDKGRIDCGFAIIDTAPNNDTQMWMSTV